MAYHNYNPVPNITPKLVPIAEIVPREVRTRLNPQGLARKDKGLMSAIVPDPGHVFVSCDLSSGEPTVTAHYSKDRNYFDACFGMVGKRPIFTTRGVLKIDNLYLTVMSQSPMGREIAKHLYSAKYGGQSFAERWKTNAPYEGSPFQDYVKDQIKGAYAFHKMGTLGMGYGMGPKKFQAAAYDAGHNITLKEAQGFYSTYWTLFTGLRVFAAHCERQYKAKGYLVNDFGYRLVPDQPFKSFNYVIQSSVSGIMHVIAAQFFARAPFCAFLFVIHDEVVFSCPEGRVEEARAAMQGATDALNEMLGWKVKVRVGFKTGTNLYEAK